ncbi:MAG TPA: porin [Cyclobacteriaceae bacterium]|nr:porin [Cyclobacteriaceae bacterium]
MKKTHLLILLISLFTSQLVMAQEEAESSPVSISGSVDAYYRTNFNAPNKGEFAQAPGTSFANLPGFALGMANIITTYEGEKVGFVADLVFGPRGADAVFLSTGSANIVNQLYMYWTVNDALTLTIGNFNTYLGYEVISPTGNFNYSTSYMFSSGPFSHTGLRADISLSDNWSLMASVMNPTDYTDFNPLGTYTAGLQLGYENEGGGTWLNFLYGDQDGKLDEDYGLSTGESSGGTTFQVDLTTGYNVTESVYLGLNTTYLTTSAGEFYDGSTIRDADGDAAGFYGVAGYVQATASEKFGIGARAEYFSIFNDGGSAIATDPTNGDGNVLAVTLSGNIKPAGNLTLIPELRFDTAPEASSFINRSLDPSKSLASFLLAAVFSF